jgi:hypothetical protein
MVALQRDSVFLAKSIQLSTTRHLHAASKANLGSFNGPGFVAFAENGFIKTGIVGINYFALNQWPYFCPHNGPRVCILKLAISETVDQGLKEPAGRFIGSHKTINLPDLVWCIDNGEAHRASDCVGFVPSFEIDGHKRFEGWLPPPILLGPITFHIPPSPNFVK